MKKYSQKWEEKEFKQKVGPLLEEFDLRNSRTRLNTDDGEVQWEEIQVKRVSKKAIFAAQFLFFTRRVILCLSLVFINTFLWG